MPLDTAERLPRFAAAPPSTTQCDRPLAQALMVIVPKEKRAEVETGIENMDIGALKAAQPGRPLRVTNGVETFNSTAILRASK